MEAPLPDDETERLAALSDHKILDTAPEEEFDDLVRLAAHVCGVPIAAVSLIDEHRQWFKSIVGLAATETPREAAFCAHTILQSELMIVPDAQTDSRFADNPLVTGDPGIRFYAGVPLITEEGYALGSLCVIDRIPRQITPEQQETLRLLARQVASHLKAARRVAERERLVQEKEHLLAEKECLAAIIGSSADAIYGKTLDGTITSWNQGAEQLYGYCADEIIGQHVDILVSLERRGEIEDILAAVRRGETVASEETVRVTKAGQRVHVSLQVSSIRDAGGNVIGASVIARDITERVQSEAERLRLAAIVETSSDAIYSKTLDGRITSWNHGAECLYGYTAAEIIGQHVNILVPDEHQGEVQDIMAAVRGGVSVVPLETARRTKTGALVTVSLRVSPILDRDGTVLGASMIAHDITARKQAERALQAEREFTNALLESLQEGIVACDAHGTLSLFNSATREFHGLPEQPLSPEQWAEHFDLYEADGVTPMRTQNIPLLRAFQGETVREAEIVIAPKFGPARTLLVNGQAIYGPNGERLGAVAAMHDITERKRAEASLAESRQRLTLATESAQIGIWDWDVVANKMLWDAQMYALYGIREQDFSGAYDAWQSGLHQEDRTRAEAEILPALEGSRDFHTQFRVIWPNGEVRHLEAHAVVERASDGSPQRMIGVNWDITERKHTESALVESEARFRTSIDAMEEGMALQGADGAILMCNESAERILGLTADQMAGRTSLDPRWRSVREDGTDFPGSQHPAMVALRDGTPQRNVVMGIHKPSGELTWVNINAVPLRTEQEFGNALAQSRGVVVTFSDITERKRQEEALRQSQAELLAVLEGAPVILYATDAEGTVTLSEGTGLAALGLKPGEVIGRSVYEFSGGDAEIEAHTRRALAGEAASYDAQYAGLCLHTELRPVRDASDTVTGIIGVCFDVTERVASEERFRVLFEQSSDAHLLFGEYGIIDCNPAAVALLRCSDITEVLSLHPAVLSPEFQPDGRRSDEKCIEMDALARKHGYHRFEWTHRKMDGEEFPVEVTLTPVTLGNRPVLLTVWHDLTERKQAEQQTKDYAILLEFQKTELERSNAELGAVNAQLENLATTDGLTGLHNHRAFQERLAEEVSRAVRYDTPLSLVLLDVDKFKSYNDTHGHPAGDTVLKSVARVLQSCVRDTDMVARYGGEEFVFILTQTDLNGAATFAERLRTEIESYPWPERAVTASFGVASLHAANESGADLVVRADAALYRAKKEGRNRVICDQASSLLRAYSQSVETTLLNK